MINEYIPCLLSMPELRKYREHKEVYRPCADLAITMEDIKNAVVAETTDVCDGNNVLLWSKNDHIGRIQYFINNPESLKDIYVQAGSNKCFIEDGNHRFMAACLTNLSVIPGWIIGDKQMIASVTIA